MITCFNHLVNMRNTPPNWLLIKGLRSARNRYQHHHHISQRNHVVIEWLPEQRLRHELMSWHVYKSWVVRVDRGGKLARNITSYSRQLRFGELVLTGHWPENTTSSATFSLNKVKHFLQRWRKYHITPGGNAMFSGITRTRAPLPQRAE